MEIKCKYCGQENYNANFCIKCGRKLQKICNYCWIKKMPYSCGESNCLSYKLCKNNSNQKTIDNYKNILEIKADGQPVKFKLNGIPLKKVCSYELNNNGYYKKLTITIDIDEMYSI